MVKRNDQKLFRDFDKRGKSNMTKSKEMKPLEDYSKTAIEREINNALELEGKMKMVSLDRANKKVLALTILNFGIKTKTPLSSLEILKTKAFWNAR